MHDNDELCISQVRMNRLAFFKLCEMLENIGGSRPRRNMTINEQVARFFFILFLIILRIELLDRNFKG